jgi:hypothetical protein
MNDLYFATVEEAAFQLRLPLLLTAPSAVGVPHLGSRLSEYAPRTVLGARLFHRLSLPPTYEPPAIWIVAPEETVEHLGWAVGLAEHVARAGRTAVLLDLDRGQPLRGVVGGNGQPLPPSVRGRLARLGVSQAAAWTSDLQGVRIVLPVPQVPEAPEMELSANWLLVVARTLPETIQEISLLAGNVDGVVLAAGIRDHSRQELEEIVRALRNAGGSILGMVAMGPAAERQAPELLPPAQSQSAGPALEAVAAAPIAPAPPPQPQPPVWPRAVPPPPPPPEPPRHEPPTPVAPPSIEPRESAVALAAEWDRRSGRARWKRVFVTTLFALAGLALVAWVLMRMEILPPLPGPPEAGRDEEPATEGPPGGSVEDLGDLGFETPGDGSTALTPADSLGERATPDSAGVEEATTGTGVADTYIVGMNDAPEDTSDAEHALSPDDQAVSSRPAQDAPEPTPALVPVPVPAPSETLPAVLPPPETHPVRADTLRPIGTQTARTDSFVVHVSSFRRESDALTEIERLRSNGIEGRIVPIILEGRGRWLRIVVGNYPDSLTAVAEATRLRGAGLVSFSQVLGGGGRGVVATAPAR